MQTNPNSDPHGRTRGTGILITNLGTPDAPTAPAVRRYLAEFLSDPRVVNRPRWLWLPILYGVILNIRPRRSAHAYQQIWTREGSPLLVISRKQETALKQSLHNSFPGAPVHVTLGMRYGNPSLASALHTLRAAGIARLLVLPLYPQYSAATTASTFDAIARELKSWWWQPELRFISSYHDDAAYINALADSVRAHWQKHGRGEKLLMSFHGLPASYLTSGDPYHCQCHKTARLLAEALRLEPAQWQVTFQSRVGYEKWLPPYTDETLKSLPASGCQRVDLICPGFAADCLETLEENAIRNRDLFLRAGGKQFNYIPCLNDAAAHIALLQKLITRHAQGWPEFSGWDRARHERELQETAARAAQIQAQNLRGA